MNTEMQPVRIAIFASGMGSNAREIIRYFHEAGHNVLGRKVEIGLIACNKTGAGVIQVAAESGIPVLMLERITFESPNSCLQELTGHNISFIVLAGFLWKIPAALIRAYPERILNIHPGLLPNYGGKGMYGKAVHKAVVENNERESGITIHYVDEVYDHGRLFFQANFNLAPGETAESLAIRIGKLEHEHFPEQIARWIECKLSLNP